MRSSTYKSREEDIRGRERAYKCREDIIGRDRTGEGVGTYDDSARDSERTKEEERALPSDRKGDRREGD